MSTFRSGAARGETSRWWYGVAIGVTVWAVFLSSVDLEWNPRLADSVLLLAVVTWPLIPAALYLDLRAIRDRIVWDPETKLWVLVSFVWFANLPAGVAYCLRRMGALRGDAPSGEWRYGVYAGFLGWVGVVAADIAVDHVSIGPLEPIVFGPFLAVVWAGFPVVLYLDAEHVRAHTDMEPNLRGLVALSVVPLLNLLVGLFYLGGRWWHYRRTDPDEPVTLPDDAGAGSGRSESLSPWYRRAVGVYVLYILLVAVLGSWLPLESDFAWDVLALVVWPLFGTVFTACYHFDNRAVREAGVDWGGTRYVYYLAVVVPALAFWYLLSRYTKVSRARSDGTFTTADDDSAPDPTDDGPDRNDDGSDFEWGDGPDR